MSQPVYTICAKDDPSQGLDTGATRTWRPWKCDTQPAFSFLKRKVTPLHPIHNRM